jgi:hypothetical protein
VEGGALRSRKEMAAAAVVVAHGALPLGRQPCWALLRPSRLAAAELAAPRPLRTTAPATTAPQVGIPYSATGSWLAAAEAVREQEEGQRALRAEGCTLQEAVAPRGTMTGTPFGPRMPEVQLPQRVEEGEEVLLMPATTFKPPRQAARALTIGVFL